MSCEPEDIYKICISPEYILCFSLTFNSCLTYIKCYNIFNDSSKSHSKVFKLLFKEMWFFSPPISLGFTYFSSIAQGQYEDRRSIALHTSNNFMIQNGSMREKRPWAFSSLGHQRRLPMVKSNTVN